MDANKIRKVAVALRLSFSSHRDILQGISRFAKSHHWQLQLVSIPDAFTCASLKTLAQTQPDGFITCDIGSTDITRFFSQLACPLAIVGTSDKELPDRRHTLAFVNNNDLDIGAFGARYLCSLGKFRSFGFVCENVRNSCSTLRLEGFKRQLGLRRESVFVYPPQSCPDGSEEDIAALTEWLRRLPKPAAVMAVFDLRATQVMEAARRTAIEIPGQLAVLGVDNDELLCDFTEPPLTSVAPDFVNEGELAAKALNGLMRGRKKGVQIVTSSSKRLIRRGSAAPIAPAAQLVDQALAFIRRHALDGIGAADVIDHLGVSRRLADRRFREATGSSILETILKIRLKAVREKLTTTDAAIGLITEQCGFRSENYAKNLFRRRFGQSMSAYRKSR